MDRSSFYEADDGAQIWYGTVGHGDGAPIVLCDGLACDGFIWPYLIDHFVDRHMLVRWHYRGHGLSQMPGDGYDCLTIERMSQDLAGVMDRLELDQAVFAGHSMGVQVILEHAHRRPEQVAGLVPICGSYKRPLDTLHNTDLLLQALPFLQRAVDSAPDVAQTMWRTMVPSRISRLIALTFEVNMRLAHQEDFAPYLEHVAEMDINVFLKLLAAVGDHSAEDYLADIAAPALVIAGERDAITPLYRSEEMVELLADAELLVVPGGTHVAPIEVPELVNGAIEKCLGVWGLG